MLTATFFLLLHQTVLQQHCRYWDRDNDGQIYPQDTFVGFRDLGFNLLFSFLMAVIIHSGLSYPTCLGHSWFPDPLFRIFIDSIHKAKVCREGKEIV